MWGYWQLSLRLIVVGFLAPLSIGLTLTLAGYFLTRNSSDLEIHGDVVRARIRESEVRGDRYWVLFEYLDDKSVLHRGETLLEGPGASAAKTAGFVEIRYDRRRPELYDIATSGRQSMDRTLRIGVLVLGVVLVLVAFAIFARRAFQIYRIVSLIRNGFGITSAVRTHVIEDKAVGPTQFTYAYQGPNGRWYEGISPVIPPNYVEKFPVGHPIRIVFDRDEPRRSEVDLFSIRPKS
jgi:hypothetical protein